MAEKTPALERLATLHRAIQAIQHGDLTAQDLGLEMGRLAVRGMPDHANDSDRVFDEARKYYGRNHN